ncbi:MAG: hypothetical protein KGV43_01865 [Arcobacter sp.]|nr:hypothetical protein [Arcobacter sp.]
MKKICILFLYVSFLFSHKLNVFTEYEDGLLFVNSYFANGNPCKNCSVTISSLDGKILDKNKTDNKGEYYKKIQEKEFEITVNGSSGHISKKIVQNSEKEEKETITHNVSDNELDKIKDENNKLKMKIKSLEKQLEMKEFFKIFFALLIIILIFVFLKRIKK